MAKWPEDASAWQWRLTSLAKLTTTPDSQIESVGEMLLKVNKEHPFQGVRFVSYKTEVAQIWMRRNIRLEDCLELAREGLADVEHAEQANPSAANRFKSMFGRGEMQSLLVEAEAARKLNKLDIAAQATAEMERRRDDDPAKYSTRGPANPWTEMNRPLARFQGIDLTGRTWTREDFKGKSTLVVIWATWCGPCHAELPQVQKLFEAITDRKNVQLVTVSTDKSADDVRAFVAKNKYTFPVVQMSGEAVDQLAGIAGIPRTWLVDATGVLRFEIVGFDPTLWPDEMMRRLSALLQ